MKCFLKIFINFKFLIHPEYFYRNTIYNFRFSTKINRKFYFDKFNKKFHGDGTGLLFLFFENLYMSNQISLHKTKQNKI